MGVILTRAPWQYGKALSFDGDDYVEFGNIMSFSWTDAFSFEFRMKSSQNATYIGIVYKGGGHNIYAIWLHWGYVELYMGSWAKGKRCWTRTPNTLIDNLWHHLVITYDGSKLASGHGYYVDGQSVTPVTIDDDIEDDILSTANFYIGRDPGSSTYYNGLIDSFCIYNRILSAGEARNNYLSMKPVNTAGLVLWLKMDEVNGDKVFDYSGGNDGTLKPSYPDNCPSRVQGIAPAW